MDKQLINIEKDFRKWLVFSESAKNNEMLKTLKKVVLNKKSNKGISFEKVKTDLNKEYFISENGNPLTLKVEERDYPVFVDYFQKHYDNESVYSKNEKILAPKFSGSSQRNLSNSKKKLPLLELNNQTPILNFLKKISSINKLKHVFNYSLATLLILQIVIIPGNLGGYRPGDVGTNMSFIIMFLMWYLNFWTYTKFFPMDNTYREIFRLTVTYFAMLWLFIIVEITIISLFRPEFNLWFYLLLLFLGQIAGIIMGLFTTMVMYFIKGGKIINVK